MADPSISIVVPFYNNAELLGACLASIAAQTYPDLEVIAVDDGSTDGSAAVAKAVTSADSRFRLVQVPNGGPGSARNHGVAAATGEYLAFVDADDLLPPEAYATLIGVLDQSGSDFVSGGVLRLTADGLGASGLHDQAIKARRLRTHLRRTPELLFDISVWNKLFRRSFWNSAGLRFPEGMLWEDLVAMTKAHVLAQAVDVITEPIYHWRDRDKGAPSITQSRTSIGNFRDRITALGMIDEFLRERATPALLRQHQHKALVNDLWLYVRDLAATGPAYQAEFVDLAGQYLAKVDKRLIGELPATRKLACHLIKARRTEDLVEFAAWLTANPARTPPMVRSFGRLRADLPLRTAEDRAIPASVFKPQYRELAPHVQVDKISWQGRSLVVEGSAYVPSMDIGARRNTTKLVVLVPRRRGRPPIVVPARSVRRADVTDGSGQSRYSYDWAGFRVLIGPRWFKVGKRWLTGEWDSFILVRGRASWRPARLHTPGPQAASPQPLRVAAGVTFGASWAGKRLRVQVKRAQDEPVATPASAAVSQTWDDEGRLVVRGAGPDAPPDQVVLTRLGGWERHVVPIPAGGQNVDQPGRFSVGLAVGAVECFGDHRPLRDGRWQISFRRAADQTPLRLQVGVDPREVRIGRKSYRCEAGEGLLLTVAPVLGLLERGRIRRRLLREIYYRAQRLLPLRDSVLLMSFDGKSCTDNPLGVARELARRSDPRERIWAVDDWSVPTPPGSKAVLIGTRQYLAALARSSYLVTNNHLALPYRHRPGQCYAQTWHGTPLKRLGWDIVNPSFASGTWYFEFLARDVAQWDVLISPNSFSTPIMRQAFRYAGEIAETGYPRADALLAARDGAAADPDPGQVRERLGIPPGKKVALYVPTWRENQHDDAGGYRFDLKLDLAAARRRLAADYVLLVRGHHLMAGWVLADAEPGFVFDVTGYPDINDLLAVADVLVTDYSSVMFDFAPTGRPMIFYTYDLAEYRDQLRGFYFDFEADAPGPLVRGSDELIEELTHLDGVIASYSRARAAFTARFCPLDDGKASARACDRIFKD